MPVSQCATPVAACNGPDGAPTARLRGSVKLVEYFQSVKSIAPIDKTAQLTYVAAPAVGPPTGL